MDMINALRVFNAVVASGSFTAAAEALDLSRPRVSKHIAELEQHFGVRLLQRTTRSMTLTEAGRECHAFSQRITAECQALEEYMGNQGQPGGTLRVSAPHPYCRAELAAIVAAYQRRYPRVAVEFCLSDQLVNLIEQGIDVAIRVANLSDSTLVARRLCDIPRILCASPEYLARHDVPATPQALRDHNCLMYSLLPRTEQWEYLDAQGRAIEVPVFGTLRANSGDALLASALEGRGIILEPEFVVREALAAGALVRVMAEYVWTSRSLYVLYVNRRYLPVNIRSFVDFLAEYYQRAAFSAGG
ncbi:LysR family transcriptional regulator [Klebsiella oxytoca]|nr:LysR family transcriptional regulator [Klebsiella oxytoca]HEO8934454.1 LysR family transcriptional regulator [Serratia marcescens]HEP0991559.1 LysR family transcriptional regulator [Serratia marcescens]